MAQRLGPASEALALNWLGAAFMELGRVAEAERVLSSSLTRLEQLRAQGSYDAEAHVKVLTSLAAIDLHLERNRNAEHHLLQALTIWRGVARSQTNEEFAAFLNNLGVLRYRQRRLHDAEQHLREALGIWRESVLPGDPRPPVGMAHLAGILSLLGKNDEADRLSAQALDSFASVVHPNPLIASKLLSIRAQVLRRSKRGREAKALETKARDLLRQNENADVVDLSVLGARRLAPSPVR
jgi:tetratricopeptide (TPR) repeat protein